MLEDVKKFCSSNGSKGKCFEKVTRRKKERRRRIRERERERERERKRE